MKQGILLINLGTPNAPDVKSVRRYLREFLLDPRVIDLPIGLRWSLVNLVILPLRPKKSAAAYQQVWLAEGSPLLVYMRKLTEALVLELGDEYKIEFGMRYGNPSIESALAKLNDCASIIVLPLFPQYSSAATGSAIAKLLQLVSNQWNIPQLFIIRDFYNHPDFIKSYSAIIKNSILNKKVDLVLFSFHGLPERHITKSDCRANCDHIQSCPAVTDENRYCYRAQCYATAKLLADELGLKESEYKVAFQSRLGRTPWIKPYTDILLPELRQQGVKNIAVVSPSFTVDCLETLEEIGIRAREQWKSLKGEELILVPCLNDDSLWVTSLAKMVLHQNLTGGSYG